MNYFKSIFKILDKKYGYYFAKLIFIYPLLILLSNQQPYNKDVRFKNIAKQNYLIFAYFK